MDFTEKTLERTEIFSGAIVHLHVDSITLPNGKPASREVVEHPGGVVILALDGDDCVTLVRQYRYPFARVITELPAGKLEPGEDCRLAALRELQEEVGLTPDTLTDLGCLYASPGFCTEVLHLYLAQGLHRGDCHPDEDEFLERLTLPFDTVVAQIASGELSDAKTVAAVLKAKLMLGR